MGISDVASKEGMDGCTVHTVGSGGKVGLMVSQLEERNGAHGLERGASGLARGQGRDDLGRDREGEAGGRSLSLKKVADEQAGADFVASVGGAGGGREHSGGSEERSLMSSRV